MPLNESTRKVRERWPAAFDIEGIPRDNALRQRLLDEIQSKESTMAQLRQSSIDAYNSSRPENVFAVDKAQTAPQADEPFISDINNPPQRRYQYREYPKMLYHHESGRTVRIEDTPQAAAQEKALLKQGFKTEPSPKHDYSRVARAGSVAPLKTVVAERERDLTPEELMELEAQDKE